MQPRAATGLAHSPEEWHRDDFREKGLAHQR